MTGRDRVTPARSPIVRPATILFGGILLITGCTSGATDTPTISNNGSSSPTASTTPYPGTAPPPPSDEATVRPVPEASDASQASAILAAENLTTAFGRPDLTYTDWINGLYPHLTQAGAAAYEDTDPALIPVTHTTGPGLVLPGSTELALTIQVPTNAGPYNVSLTRPNDNANWLADRIRPAGA
jgi:hypothetical protein